MTSDPSSGLAALSSGAILSPFTRLRRLLEGIAPGHAHPIELTVGEPREAMPAFVVDRLAEARDLYAKYPAIRGSDALRTSIADWAARRYGPAARPDPATEILPLNGSREGLFYAALPAMGRQRDRTARTTVLPPAGTRPAILLPNPYYAAYLGAALAVGAEPVLLDATAATGHLPDLDALEAQPELLARTTAFYLCSPANPQGAVASPAYLARALALARRYDFLLFSDECYSEIYTLDPPPGALAIAAAGPERFRNLVVFNSLSKRSNLPGLRSGFCAGDAAFLETFAEVRNIVAPQVPGPTQHASAAVWAEEQHVAVARQAYRRKLDICDRVLAGRLGYVRPAGGFFLWLDLGQAGGGEAATTTLWKGCGVKVIPGSYLAQTGRDGRNPGDDFVRIALVDSPERIEEALHRIVSVLES